MRALKTLLKGLAVLLAAILLAVGGFLAWNWPQLSAFPSTPSAYEAKELCSCLWVERRDLPYCEAWVRQTVVPSDGHTIDETHHRVEASALGRKARARWLGPKVGCQIEAH